MKVVVAIDSLKGSLSSIEAGEAIKEGILKANENANVVVRPLADGGEGTVDALVAGMHGSYVDCDVTGPHGRKITARYGTIDQGKTAIIEMSAAAGITLVSGEEKNPLYTTTYGVGEIIRHAILHGCRHFIIGIGGSATNDVGIGMLQALGFHFLDAQGKEVCHGALGVKDIVSFTTKEAMPELCDCCFEIACDVTNPLCGKRGCSAVYGPQKGADEEMVGHMDHWIHNFANLVESEIEGADSFVPGTGAAGGLGYAFLNFLHGNLKSGISIILSETNLRDYVRDADIVVTGEGRLDGQSAMGKAPIGVAKLAKEEGCKVIAFAGSVTKDAKLCNREGIDAYFPILREICTLEEAMDAQNARENMIDTVEQVFRLL